MLDLGRMELPEIATFPEWRMGAHRVALLLRDGSIVEDVKVAWTREIVSIGDSRTFELAVDELTGVENRG